VAALLTAGRDALKRRQSQLALLTSIAQQAQEYWSLEQSFNSDDAQRRRESIRSSLATAASAKSEAQEKLAKAEEELSRQEQADAVATSLSLLLEHGEQLGLHHDHCPLCDAKRTHEEFEAGLTLLRERIKGTAKNAQEGFVVLKHAVVVELQNKFFLLPASSG
jgi:chromosome segregation protein